MLAYNRNIPLISLHVPKCAGTSFERVLKQWFGRRLFLHYYNAETHTAPKKHDIYHRIFRWRYKRDICIHGHFRWEYGFGAHDYYPQIEHYITILRDPFEQTVSNYFFQKKQSEERVVYSGKKMAIEEEYGSLKDYLLNAPSMTLQTLLPEINRDNYADIFEQYFVYVGVVEELQHSVDVLADKLGKARVEIPHINASLRDIELSDEQAVRAEFREKNELSYLLYEYARTHFAG